MENKSQKKKAAARGTGLRPSIVVRLTPVPDMPRQTIERFNRKNFKDDLAKVLKERAEDWLHHFSFHFEVDVSGRYVGTNQVFVELK